MIKTKSILILGLITLAIGCQEADPHAGHNHGHESHSDHGHAHQMSRLSWSTDHEVFIQYKPLIAGETENFTLHITALNGYNPYSGEVKYEVLSNTGNSVGKGTAEMKSEGIYKHRVELEAGTYNIRYLLNTGEQSDQLSFEQIAVFATEQEAEHNAHENTHDDPNTVTFEKEQAWSAGFSTAFATVDTVYDVIRAGGELVGAIGDEQTVAALASGILVYAPNVLTGMEVRKGQRLFTIVGSGMADHNLETHFLKAKANLEKATANFERKSDLAESQAISKAELEEAELEYNLARAEYENIAKGYSSGGKIITAGSSGYIKKLYHAEGAFVEAGEKLAVITENKKLILKAHVDQSEYKKLPLIKSANFQVDGKAYSVSEFNGQLISYGKTVSAEEPKIPVHFELDNINDLMTGAFAEVFIQTGNGKPGVVVPEEALLEDYGQYSVVIQVGGETFQVRPVRIGSSNGKVVRILDGVAAGERIVLDGAYQVKMAKMSGKIPAHMH